MKEAALILLLFRHLHFFVVVNETTAPPVLQLQSRQYSVYSDALRLSAYDDASTEVWRTRVPVGSAVKHPLPGPGSPFYLVVADPGMNGATFECDRPWAVLAGTNHRLGANGPGPVLYFYVPAGCERFTLGAQSVSPNEGGRVVVCDPAGREVGVLDGELDAEQEEQVGVPAEDRDRVWSLSWSAPRTAKAALDDLNIWLDGPLTALLFPRREWAERHGRALWERDRAARERDGPAGQP